MVASPPPAAAPLLLIHPTIIDILSMFIYSFFHESTKKMMFSPW